METKERMIELNIFFRRVPPHGRLRDFRAGCDISGKIIKNRKHFYAGYVPVFCKFPIDGIQYAADGGGGILRIKGQDFDFRYAGFLKCAQCFRDRGATATHGHYYMDPFFFPFGQSRMKALMEIRRMNQQWRALVRPNLLVSLCAARGSKRQYNTVEQQAAGYGMDIDYSRVGQELS